MTAEIEIRGYLPGDEEEIINLLILCFNGWPRFDINYTKLDHWKWKFSDDVSKNTMAIAIHGNKIVGIFLIVIHNFKIGDSIFPTSNGVDVSTHPDYRGLGLFNKTREYVGKQRSIFSIKTHLGRSGNPIVAQKYEKEFKANPKLWPRIPFELNWMIKINDINEYMEKNPSGYAVLKKIGYKTLSSAHRMKRILTPISKNNNEVKLRQIDKFDDLVNEFWDSIKHNYDFIQERKKEYLNWRYFDPRAGHYRVIQAEENDKVVGYSVLRINRYESDNVKGYIVDLIALNNRPDVVNLLLSDATNYFSSLNVNVVFTLVFEKHPNQKIYYKYGFITYSKEYMYLWLTEDLGYPIEVLMKTKIERTHMSLGDEDEI